MSVFTEAAEASGPLRVVLLLLKEEILKCSISVGAQGEKITFADECLFKGYELEQLKASTKSLEVELDEVEVLSKKLQDDLDNEKQQTQSLREEIRTLRQEFCHSIKELTNKNQELQQVKDDLTQNALSLHREVKELKAKNDSSKLALQQHQMERMRSEGLRQRFEMLDKQRHDNSLSADPSHFVGKLISEATTPQLLRELQECLHLDSQLEVLINARVSKFEDSFVKVTSAAFRKRVQQSFVDELADLSKERESQSNHIQELHASLSYALSRAQDDDASKASKQMYMSMQRDLVPHLLKKNLAVPSNGANELMNECTEERRLKTSSCHYWQDFVDVRGGNILTRFRTMSLSELLSFLEDLWRSKTHDEAREFTSFLQQPDYSSSDGHIPHPLPLLHYLYTFLEQRYLSIHAVLSVAGLYFCLSFFLTGISFFLTGISFFLTGTYFFLSVFLTRQHLERCR